MLTRSGARTPEELETLLEDALLTRDLVGLATLFVDDAALAAKGERPSRGRDASARRALALCGGGHPYLAATRPALMTRELALVVGEHGINVMRRGQDGAWRYAMVWHMDADDE